MHYYTVYILQSHCRDYLAGIERGQPSHQRRAAVLWRLSDSTLSLLPFVLPEYKSFIRAGDLTVWNTSSGHLPVGGKGARIKDRDSLTFKKWMTSNWQREHIFFLYCSLFCLHIFRGNEKLTRPRKRITEIECLCFVYVCLMDMKAAVWLLLYSTSLSCSTSHTSPP